MEFIKITCVKNTKLLGTNWKKQILLINPDNINGIFDYTEDENRTIQSVLLINGERLNVCETPEEIQALISKRKIVIK